MIYFDNGATTFPKPESVVEAMVYHQKNACANPGRAAHILARKATEAVTDCRIKIAEMMGVKNPMNVIFTKNCSEALSLALTGVINENEHIITTSIEHNSLTRVLEHLKNIRNITVSYIEPEKDGEKFLKKISEEIRDNTSLIAINHANNLTGMVNDIKAVGELAKEKGIKYLVDGAQSAGKLPINMQEMNIDFLCCPGHKSLYGPQGTGFLCINGKHELTPLTFGGTGSLSAEIGYISQVPDKFEVGTLNSIGIAGLSAGIDHIKEIGMDNIRKKEEELNSYIHKKMSEIDDVILYSDEKSCAILAFNIKGMNSTEVAMKLDQKGICIRGSLHCNAKGHEFLGTIETGICRASFSHFNTRQEVDEFIEAIKEIAKDK